VPAGSATDQSRRSNTTSTDRLPAAIEPEVPRVSRCSRTRQGGGDAGVDFWREGRARLDGFDVARAFDVRGLGGWWWGGRRGRRT
jgi:hypothetical protein